jgi:hypothetical protein
MSTRGQHDEDFYTWATESAALIRAGRLQDLDLEHLAEELEDMGASRERELESRLAILAAHLLKWRYQPERRGNSWRATIKEQRRRLERLLRRNPGLAPRLSEAFQDAYGDARLIAMRETGMDEDTFPEQAPFSLEQCLTEGYWPA